MKIQEINSESRLQSKEYIQRKKKFKRRIFWIKFVILFLLSSAAVIMLALSPLFNLKSIEVKGSKHYSNAEIINSTGIIIGNNGFKTIGSSVSNIFTLSYGSGEKNIINLFPYVKSVRVRFSLPDKIKISIKERTPFTYLNFKGTYLYMDEEKYIVDTLSPDKTKSLLEIKGLKIPEYKLGKEIKPDDPEKFQCFMKLYNALLESDKSETYKIAKKLKFIDVSDLNRITANLDSRISINFGDLFDLSYKIDFLKKNLAEISESDKGYLDMTLEQPVFKPDNN